MQDMMASDSAYKSESSLAEYKLQSLLEITMEINANSPADTLLQKYREILCQALQVRRLAVFIVNQSWTCALTVGLPDNFSTNQDEISSQLIQYTEITSLDKDDILFKFYPFSFIIPVFHKQNPLAYVLLGDDVNNNEQSPLILHLNFIQTLTNIVIVAIENKRLYKKSIEQEALKKELEVASKLQAMLIPSADALPNNQSLKVTAYYQPHSMVGGDYYDCIQLSSTEYGLCIGDVSGKGISAAIMMANFQANLRILFKRKIPLIHLVKDLNQNVNKNSQGDRFVTFFVARYNAEDRTLSYINAGHNPPLLLCRENKELIYLTKGCVGLGMIEEIPAITVGNVHISPGDTLICYTDGLVEAENSKGVPFGTVPIEGAMTIEGSIDDIVYTIRKELEEFLQKRPVSDDISIFGVDFL